MYQGRERQQLCSSVALGRRPAGWHHAQRHRLDSQSHKCARRGLCSSGLTTRQQGGLHISTPSTHNACPPSQMEPMYKCTHRRLVARVQLLAQRQQAVGGGSAHHARAHACGSERVNSAQLLSCAGCRRLLQVAGLHLRTCLRKLELRAGRRRSGQRGQHSDWHVVTLPQSAQGRAPLPSGSNWGDNSSRPGELLRQAVQIPCSSHTSCHPPMKANTAPLYTKLTMREPTEKPGMNMWPAARGERRTVNEYITSEWGRQCG